MKNKGIAAAVAAAVVVIVVVAVAVPVAVVVLKGGGGGENQPSVTVPAGKKALLIIALTDFNDTEYSVTRNALTQAGVTVSVASTTTGTATGQDGMHVTPDIATYNVNVNNYDAVVFIGGTGVEAAYFDDTTAWQIASNANNQGKVVAAICIAPVVLANAGILNGKQATVYSGNQAQLEAGGATYTGQSVTVDGKIITANGPDAATEFANAIKSALAQ